MSRLPLMFDLFCGLGGATSGFLVEGWECIGIDIERHEYGDERYPSQLWLQDILTISGAQLKDAEFIWASPPCTEFSWMAMPWSRAKQVARALRGEDEFPDRYTGSRTVAELTALFDACFRIQREACESAGRHIPLVVENVRGAQEWVGRSQTKCGPYHLWGDVPALMPIIASAAKQPGHWFKDSGTASGSARFGSKSRERKEWSAMIAKIPLPLSSYIGATYHPNRVAA